MFPAIGAVELHVAQLSFQATNAGVDFVERLQHALWLVLAIVDVDRRYWVVVQMGQDGAEAKLDVGEMGEQMGQH